jgi:hypothetical protein
MINDIDVYITILNLRNTSKLIVFVEIFDMKW